MVLNTWGAFLVRRIWTAAMAMVLASMLVYWIAAEGPGDFLSDLRSDPQVSRSTVQSEERRLQLREAWLTRYAGWAGGMIRGDWGRSYSNGMAVSELLRPRMERTLELSLQAMFLTWAIAIGLAAMAVQTRWERLDRALRYSQVALLALPDLCIILGLALVFARLQERLDEGLAPVLALTLCILPSLTLQVRAAFVRASAEPFVAAARRRGIAEAVVTTRYIAPAAAPELSALAGMSLGWTLSASLLVECTLGYPGLGPILWTSLLARDIPVVAGASMITLAAWMAGNLAADLLQFIADPRVRRQAA